MVADAAGLSDMAIHRRAHRLRRSISSEEEQDAERDGEEDDERLAVAGVAADLEAEELQRLVQRAGVGDARCIFGMAERSPCR